MEWRTGRLRYCDTPSYVRDLYEYGLFERQTLSNVFPRSSDYGTPNPALRFSFQFLIRHYISRISLSKHSRLNSAETTISCEIPLPQADADSVYEAAPVGALEMENATLIA